MTTLKNYECGIDHSHSVHDSAHNLINVADNLSGTSDHHLCMKDIETTIQYEQERLKTLKERSEKTPITILNTIRSKVSFWGVLSLFDANEISKIEMKKL
jgi:hypothetical protein